MWLSNCWLWVCVARHLLIVDTSQLLLLASGHTYSAYALLCAQNSGTTKIMTTYRSHCQEQCLPTLHRRSCWRRVLQDKLCYNDHFDHNVRKCYRRNTSFHSERLRICTSVKYNVPDIQVLFVNYDWINAGFGMNEFIEWNYSFIWDDAWKQVSISSVQQVCQVNWLN